ncbi:MAG: hypothetical protein J0I06_27385 [Planctomycetes bacterium]|nr:hypothetical protein [Planctomycetota bacterium]
MSPGPPVSYRVSQSQLVTEQFLQLVALATEQGRRRLVLRAARYVMEELAYAPVRFGESRGVLPHLDLSLRIGFAPPLYVEFAIHEPSRQVFVRRFGLYG